MICPSCTSQNAPTARFCNMCGASFLGSNLDETQRGLGVVPPSGSLHVEATIPVGPSPASGREPAARVLSVTSSASMDRNPPTSGLDPSLSLALESLGIRTPRQTVTWLSVGGALLLAAGAAGAYFAFRPEPDAGHAHAGDPFEIGAPTAEVDYVTGSLDPEVPRIAEGSVAQPSAAGAQTAAFAAQAARPTTPTTSTATDSPTPPLAPAQDPSAPPSPSTDSPTAPASTPEPAIAPTPEPGVTPEPGSTELDLEMYAARVRYLVRRYHAGEVAGCFDQATARTESLSGQVVLGMHIAADGRVSTAHVTRNTTGDEGLGNCLVGLARSWSVAPPPGGEASLSFPFSR